MKIWIRLTVFALAACLSIPSIGFTAIESLPVKQIESDFRKVAKKAIPAVVSIRVKIGEDKNKGAAPRKQLQDHFDFFGDDFFQRFFGGTPQEPSPLSGQASGFIVSSDGHIMTNSHVVHEATDITVVLNDGREFKAKLIGDDPSTDIALIKIEADSLPSLSLSNSDDLEVGQWVVAIGNPMGLQASLTVGVVSAKGRNNLDLMRIEDFIQTDAAINRGNSGGPLLNLDAEVVGINTAIVTSMATGGYMGIGFAIPSNIAKQDMDELLAKGSVSRGFMGVVLQSMDEDLAQAIGLERSEGVLISEVTKESPAEKAGLKQGDVILKLNQQPVSSVGGLRSAVSLMKPGSKVQLTIQRPKEGLQEIAVVIGEFSPPEVAQSKPLQDNLFGFDVQTLTPELGASLNLGDQKGVVITKVNGGSIAALAGLKKGSIIQQVNHKPVLSADEFNRYLQETPKGKPVLFLIRQGDSTRYISLKVGQ